jgi:hypothetical protein
MSASSEPARGGMVPAAVAPERVRPRLGNTGPGLPGRPALSDRLPRPWLFPLLVFAAAWLLILAAWYVSDAIYGASHGWTWHFLFKDAGWYLRVAEHGYPARLHRPYDAPDGGAAFFPLFPALIRLTSHLTGGSYAIAGLIVSVASGAAAALGVWKLSDLICNRRVADRAVSLFCFFPGAMTFGMLYSDPLGVALAAATLLALLSLRWGLAGISGAAATSEAPTLIAVVAAAGIAAIQAIRSRGEWRALIAPLLAPLGILAFFGYLGHRYHDYGFWSWVERKGWNQHIDWGAQTLHIILRNYPGAHENKLVNTVYIIMLVAALAGLALTIAARLPAPVTAFAVLVVLAFLISPATPRPRAVWFAFPIFIGAAAKLPRAVYWPVLVLSAAGLVFLTGWWPHHSAGPAP